ncbi:Transketolase central region [Emticicia oligotrophica DSM 17448]|uniref:Transketolase central region n=1 Tax=Emticicia oligotrophica (strain DSM 17448 / CIP 109782 / MTCC 6937 / GPTSA100-15) TaxID=929562 RepID=A0ABM5MZF5_EMTOG|nr:alpha-ketoacid dehydrogenase subunit alpha/beta [Emticicia oligotrophica]AFK02559.1 Transketolase central region [Emticicia oligotrophica DSM 17448]
MTNLLASVASTDVLLTKEEVLNDYRIACESREVSYIGRQDVFRGRAKFGVFGDGKELAQIAMSKVFRMGDFRSGYYRDQTFLAAVGGLTWQQFFAQLYAHTDTAHDPFTGGRSMNAHYGNKLLDEKGEWLDQTQMYNTICDVSSTAGQMPRAIGLAYASKLFRENPALHQFTKFSKKGNEVCFTTIGDASTSQGMFFESINAAGVLQIPIIFSVWDDGYGISVPIKYQTTKSSISEALAGFQRKENSNGIEIIVARAWNYVELIDAYQKAALYARDQHVPVLVHVVEVTQPQGHSTSGSHERYKSKERLKFEQEFDCNTLFKKWILENGYATTEEISEIEANAKDVAKKSRNAAWSAYRDSLKPEYDSALAILKKATTESKNAKAISNIREGLEKTENAARRDVIAAVKKAIRTMRFEENTAKKELSKWLNDVAPENYKRFNSHLLSEFPSSPMFVKSVAPQYTEESQFVDGREIINTYFDKLLERDPRVFAIGEDVGKIGDVNQGFAGLQEKYGEIRVTDAGIRETTIIGQGIGAAMRGLRPIVEIQYFDYIYYALATLTDDLASLRYRTVGQQKAPLIVRTRGHRLEGIWHSGSPMSAMLGSLRGMHVLVPRNFVQAAGFYNTILKGDDPALIIECLNGYRIKEKLPTNLDEICLPLGVPEVLKQGTDLTIVTYGSMCRIVMEAAQQLEEVGINVEVIDVQSLLPFDVHHSITESIKKTNRVIFADEDVPGGASAFMMQEVVDKQGAYRWLDSAPKAVSAQAHRPAYASDGDYFSKPNAETIFDAAYEIMHEAKPTLFPKLY